MENKMTVYPTLAGFKLYVNSMGSRETETTGSAPGTAKKMGEENQKEGRRIFM